MATAKRANGAGSIYIEHGAYYGRWVTVEGGMTNRKLGPVRRSTLDLDALRSFKSPVYFALGDRSNPRFYGRIAERACGLFQDCTLEVSKAAITSTRPIAPTRRAAPGG